MSPSQPLWTLEELAALASRALQEGPSEQPSGRVRELPDPRTIRYYTTIGLLDRAAEMRGRTAYYGRRHLLQIVSIKRLQAQGLSLVQVQERLIGLPSSALARIAGVPAELIESGPGAPQSTHSPASPRRREAFWKAEPSAVAPGARRPAGAPALAALTFQSIPIHARASILLSPGARRATEEDVRAIRDAARTLVELLETRGLIRETQGARDGKDASSPDGE